MTKKKKFDKWDAVLVGISLILFLISWYVLTLEQTPFILALGFFIGAGGAFVFFGIFVRNHYLKNIVRKANRK